MDQLDAMSKSCLFVKIEDDAGDESIPANKPLLFYSEITGGLWVGKKELFPYDDDYTYFFNLDGSRPSVEPTHYFVIDTPLQKGQG